MRQEGEFTELKPKGDFKFPTAQEIKSLSLDELRSVWDSNHQLLIERLRSKNVPFFGFHGAVKDSISHLKSAKQQGRVRVEVATFYKKPEDPETLLVSLYSDAHLSLNYAFRESGLRNNRQTTTEAEDQMRNGGLAILNLENEGENISTRYSFEGEPIKGAEMYFGQKEVVSERGLIFIKPENFSTIVKILSDQDLMGYPTLERRLDEERKALGEQAKQTEADKRLWGELYLNRKFAVQKAVLDSLDTIGA